MINPECEDAFCIANTALERLHTLMLLITQDGARSCLPESRSADLDFWIADLVTEAQQKLETAWRLRPDQKGAGHE